MLRGHHVPDAGLIPSLVSHSAIRSAVQPSMTYPKTSGTCLRPSSVGTRRRSYLSERDASDELPGFLQRGQFPGHLLYDVLTFLVSTLGSDPQRVPSRLSGHRKRSLMTYSFLRLVSAHLRSQARS